MTPERAERSSPIVFAALCALILVLGAFVTAVVVPRFIGLFKDLGIKEFPVPTEVLARLSDFSVARWYMFLPALAALACLLVLIATGVCPLPNRRWRIAILCISVGAIVLALFALALPIVSVVRNLQG